ncbi:MAG: hypothetical protein ACE5Q6_01660 [Dehalococcoidia bacterium]
MHVTSRSWLLLVLTVVIAFSVAVVASVAAFPGEPPLKPLPTYDRDGVPFPANVEPPFDVVAFRPYQFLMRIHVNREELNEILIPAGWVAPVGVPDDPAIITVSWGFRQHMQAPNTPGLDSQTFGPASNVSFITSAINLSDDSRHTLLLANFRSSAVAVDFFNKVLGDGIHKANLQAKISMELGNEADFGEDKLKFKGSVYEPTSGLEVEASATFPDGDEAMRVIRDSPTSRPFNSVDVSTEPITVLNPFIVASQYDTTRFASGTPGFQVEVSFPNDELRLPGGRTLSVEGVLPFLEFRDNREILVVLVDD